MNNEDKIISMLQKIMEKQDEHSQILGEHSSILKEHSSVLNEHSSILNEHSSILKEHSSVLNEHSSILKDQTNILKDHSQKHNNHAAQFKEHGQILSALLTGQEYLKAQIDEMKITNAKEFENIKEQMNQASVNQDLLREEVWQNKVDTHRIKNTMGMK